MKKWIVLVLALAAIIITSSSFAAEGGAKGASAQAYEHASDNAIFNRVGDWFATRGKSEPEKSAILAERKAKRAVDRAQKELEKRNKELAKETKKAQKAADKQTKKVKDQMKGMKKGLRAK